MLGPEAAIDLATLAAGEPVADYSPGARAIRRPAVGPDRSGLLPLDALRRPADARRHQACGRQHRRDAWLQAPVPALPRGARLSRPLRRHPARRRAGRRPRASERRGGAHHVRRSRLLQRADARAPSGRATGRGASRCHLRRDDQDRAHPGARGPVAGARRHGLPLHHERGRIGGRRGAGALAQGPHQGGFRARGRC